MIKDTKKVNPELLEMLVCPITKSPLQYEAKTNELISRQAKLAFPIKSGIPVMLVSRARKID